jgi:hypothetical protein
MKKRNPSLFQVIWRAKQRIRNVGADKSEEPEGFASGDIKKFLKDPDKYEKDNSRG